MSRRALLVASVLAVAGILLLLYRDPPRSRRVVAGQMSSHASEPEGHAHSASVPVLDRPAREPVALERDSTPLVAIEVRVLDATPGAAGRPVARAHVRLVRADLAAGVGAESELDAAFTDDEGRCLLTGLAAPGLALRASAEGLLATAVELETQPDELLALALDPRPVTLRMLARGEVVRGHVVAPDGEPLAGALVCLEPHGIRARTFARRTADDDPAPQPVWTDASGAFELTAPARQSSLSLIVCPDRPGLAAIVRQEVRAAGSERDLRVRVPAALPVVLRVARADGSPVPGRLSVSDGLSSHDLAGEELLRRIPGFAARFPGSAGSDGRLALDLPEGGYTVLFEPVSGEYDRESFYVRVSADGPPEITLEVDALEAR